MLIHRRTIFLLAISIALCVLKLGLIGIASFNFADDGYTWYGAQRTALGEFPLLDFSSYDPGRYYWIAAVMSVLQSSDFTAFQIANAFYMAVGVFFGLLVITNNGHTKITSLTIIICALTIILWMFYPVDVYNYSTILLITWGLVEYSKCNKGRNAFVLGVIVGLAAFVGRNHGLYGFIASTLLIIYLGFNGFKDKSIYTRMFQFFIGLFLGYSPMIVLSINKPEFFMSVIDSIRLLFELGQTNLPLPLPLPWDASLPWTTSLGELFYFYILNTPIALREFSKIGRALTFWGTIFISIWLLLVSLKNKISGKESDSILFAIGLIGIVAAHYPFSRAGLTKISYAFLPLLILTLHYAVRSEKFKNVMLSTILLFTLANVSHAYSEYLVCRFTQKCEVRNGVTVPKGMFDHLSNVDKIVQKYASSETDSFAVLPYGSYVYADLQRKSPVYYLYPAIPISKTRQMDEIKKISELKPKFILFTGGREGYQTNFPDVVKYIETKYQLEIQEQHVGYELYVY
ncbi:MAG: hypothetical protein ACI909_003581 [Planctomycetota bacterium]|jgi:hypothetical protein